MQGVVISVLAFLALWGIVFLVSAFRAPVLMDRERQVSSEVLDKQKREIEGEIAELKRPKATPAELHRLEIAKQSIGKHGDEAVLLLRQLQHHGHLMWGNFDPPLPSGMRPQRARELLNLLVKDEVVALNVVQVPGGYEYTYKIAPIMVATMDEVLYKSKSVSDHT